MGADQNSILRVKRCAVALLGSEVQGTEAAMQAFLKLVFRNRLGLVVVIRTKTLQTSQPGQVTMKSLLESQPLVSPEALMVIVIFIQLNANEEDDAVISSQAIDELKHGSGLTKTRACRRRASEEANI
jgi:hypothetical protein